MPTTDTSLCSSHLHSRVGHRPREDSVSPRLVQVSLSP